MNDTVDTSKEAVERIICDPIIRMVNRGGRPTLDECGAIIDTARALVSERDQLRRELEEARHAALDTANISRLKRAINSESEGYWAPTDDMLARILRGLKSEPALGHLDDECQRCGSVGGFGCYECTQGARNDNR